MNTQLIAKMLKQVQQILEGILSLASTSTESELHTKALAYLGTDASPNDLADDEVGCAESVTAIIKSIDPSEPIILGTWTMYDHMNRSTKFTPVSTPQAGDIVISPTGESRLGSKRPFVGHVGIVGRNETIMANVSATGKWQSSYTLDTWRARWVKLGGYPQLYFRFKK